MNRRLFLASTTLAAAGLSFRNVLAAAHAGPGTIRAWEIGERKGPAGLRLVTRPAPVAGPRRCPACGQTDAGHKLRPLRFCPAEQQILA